MKKFLETQVNSPSKPFTLISGQLVYARANEFLELVLNNLEKTNTKFNRLVKVDEIYNLISVEEKASFVKSIGEPLSIDVVSEILEALKRRSLAFKKSYAFNKFYGSARIFDPQQTEIGFALASRAQQTLIITKSAVLHFGRSVCYDEIFEFGKNNFKAPAVDRRIIIQSLRTLQKTNSVIVAARRHGNTRGGIYYLPSDLNPALFPAPMPNTMLDCTQYAFNELWEERLEIAEQENKSPAPLLTAEIQAKFEMIFPDLIPAKKTGYMTAVLWQIASGKKSEIRGIKLNGTRQVCWSPKNLTDQSLNIESVYANDRIKLAVAVKRACLRLRKPVTAKDVKYEIDLDASLQIYGQSSLSLALSASAEFFKQKLNTKKFNGASIFLRLGNINGSRFYYSNKLNKEEAFGYFKFLQVENEWKKLGQEENLEKLDDCRLPTVKAGRILLFLKKASSIQNELKEILKSARLSIRLRNDIEQLRLLISEFMSKFRILLNNLNFKQLPFSIPSEQMTCWNAEEMIEYFMPIHPLAPDIKLKSRSGITSRVTGMLRKVIRRVPNEAYRTSPSSLSPFAYDKTDALIFAGLRWGSNECRMQANFARIELGILRDVNFVLPELYSPEFELRIAAVSCLAFLQTAEGNKALRQLILNDPVAEVRMTALWAYAFAGGEDAVIVAEQVAVKNPNSKLGNFALEIAQTQVKELWFI